MTSFMTNKCRQNLSLTNCETVLLFVGKSTVKSYTTIIILYSLAMYVRAPLHGWKFPKKDIFLNENHNNYYVYQQVIRCLKHTLKMPATNPPKQLLLFYKAIKLVFKLFIYCMA